MPAVHKHTHIKAAGPPRSGVAAAEETAESPTPSREQRRLFELTKKLSSAVKKHKDLTKEKYREFYNKCKTVRDECEEQALEALNAGRVDAFEEIANVVHAASAIIEKFELEVERQKSVVEGGKFKASGHESDEGESWAVFPEAEEKGADGNSRAHGRTFLDLEEIHHDADNRSVNVVKHHGGKGAPALMILPRNASISASVSTAGSNRRKSIEREKSIEAWGSGEWNKQADRSQATENPARSHMGYGDRHRGDAGFNGRNGGKIPRSGYEGDYVPYERFDHGERFNADHETWGLNEMEVGNRRARSQRTEDMGDEYDGYRGNGDAYFLNFDEDCGSVPRDQLPDKGSYRSMHRPKDYGHSPSKVPVDDGHYRGEDQTFARQPAQSDRDGLHETYASLLERCLTITDCRKLASQLKKLSLRAKIDVCRSIVDGNANCTVETEESAVRKAALEAKREALRSVQKQEDDLLARPSQRATQEQKSDLMVPEPLWRVKEDGGVSAYLGRYLAEGNPLFDGIHFTAYLSLRTLPKAAMAEAHVEVKRKLHNLEVAIDVTGAGAEAIYVIERTATSMTFRCKPEVWANTLPALSLRLVESDGTHREVRIDMPIGPFSFLEPADMPRRQAERIMENDSKVGYYTASRAFAMSAKLQLNALLAALTKYFAVSKTNTRQTLTALDINGEALVATLRTNGGALIVDMWSPSEKTLASSCLSIKEVAAALAAETDKKAAERAMRTLSAFPLDFARQTESAQAKARRKPAAAAGDGQQSGDGQ
ncbi:uncharacterized protein BcabD6B2_12820 [Babesia caballi]|uniref:Uncharacterized protein n=1 Tax=Babesia caballi TaxID=5871 RepID=A0AAV4LPZ4_BABCB|nr:hypothetical protein, conserved [Babesia caballi]